MVHDQRLFHMVWCCQEVCWKENSCVDKCELKVLHPKDLCPDLNLLALSWCLQYDCCFISWHNHWALGCKWLMLQMWFLYPSSMFVVHCLWTHHLYPSLRCVPTSGICSLSPCPDWWRLLQCDPCVSGWTQNQNLSIHHEPLGWTWHVTIRPPESLVPLGQHVWFQKYVSLDLEWFFIHFAHDAVSTDPWEVSVWLPSLWQSCSWLISLT